MTSRASCSWRSRPSTTRQPDRARSRQRPATTGRLSRGTTSRSFEKHDDAAIRRAMKVAHVLSYFPPDRIGGVGEVARHVHQALLDQGHDSIVVTSGHTHTDPTVIRIAPTPGRFLLSAWRH